MSALLSPVELEQPTIGPNLRPVANQPGRSLNLPFLLFMALLLGAGLLGILLLNTAIQERSVELGELQRQSATLSYQEAALRAETEAARSTNSLAQQAATLGMVPHTGTVFLQLPDGNLTGQAKAATGQEFVAQRVTLPVVKADTQTNINAATQAQTAVSAAGTATGDAASGGAR